MRKGFQKVYNLKKLPSPGEMEDIASKWEPNRSIGSCYMWRSLEQPPAAEVTTPEKRADGGAKRKAQGECPWLDGANDAVATPTKRGPPRKK